MSFSTGRNRQIAIAGIIAVLIAGIAGLTLFNVGSVPAAQTAISQEQAAGCAALGQAVTTEAVNGTVFCGTFLTTQTSAFFSYGSCGSGQGVTAITTTTLNCATFLTTQTAVSTEAATNCGSNLLFAVNETGSGSFQCNHQLVRSLRILATHKSTNTTLTNNPYLQFAVAANTQYWFHADVFVADAGANAGLKFGLSIPANAVMTFCNEYVTNIALADLFNSCTSTNATSVGTITLGTANVQLLVQLIGFVNTGSTAGTVYVMFASVTNAIEADLEGQSVMLYYTPV